MLELRLGNKTFDQPFDIRITASPRSSSTN